MKKVIDLVGMIYLRMKYSLNQANSNAAIKRKQFYQDLVKKCFKNSKT